MKIRFATPHQYIFVHHHVKHVLLLWDKEKRKEIYVVDDESAEELVLRYPGETYTERVLQELEAVFFQTLATETEQFAAVLGVTFLYHNRLIGMYYHREQPETQPPYFFEIADEALLEISDQDYPAVVQAFQAAFPEYVQK